MSAPTPWAPLMRHVVTVAGGEAATRLFTGLAAIALARRLGGDAFGVLEFALGLVAYFQVAAAIGLEAVGTRAIAQGRAARQVAAEVVSVRLTIAVFSFLALLATSRWLPDARAGALTVLLGLLLLPSALNLRWALLAAERGKAVALVGSLVQALYLGAIVAVVHGPGDLGRVPWLLLAAEVLAAAGLFAAWNRHAVPPAERPSTTLLSQARPLLGQALPIGLTRAFGQLLYNADVVLLGFLGFLSEVGFYGAAYRILTVMLVLPMAYFAAVFPALARAWSTGTAGDSDVPRRSAAWLLGTALPAALLVCDGAPWIVRAVYGTGYEPAIAPLRLLVLALPVIAFRLLFRNLLLASHREMANLRQMALAAAANVALNLVLIVRAGILGAAVSTLLAEGLLLVLAARETRRALGPLGLSAACRAPLGGAAAMAAVLLLAQEIGAPLRCALAVGAYGAGLAASLILAPPATGGAR